MNTTSFYNNKCALVTGAASGIGESFARYLAKANCDLILVDKDGSRLADLKQQLTQEYPVQCHALISDLARIEAAQEISDQVAAKGLAVDVLINNAGFGALGDFDKTDSDTYRRMISLNVHTTTMMTHKFLSPMLKRGAGAILNVASTAAFQPLARFSVYAGTKSYVLNFTESLWGEYASRGIKISVLCPGNTATRFHETAAIGKSFIFNLMTPEAVAEKGLNGLAKGQLTIIPHIGDWVLTVMNRLCPRFIMARMTKNFYNQKQNI